MYFYKSREIIIEVVSEKPINAIKNVQNYLLKNKNIEFLNPDYPLIKKNLNQSCNLALKNQLANLLCDNYKKPNIIFIILESFRASDIGVYGGKLPLTKSFDELAQDGILFSNFLKLAKSWIISQKWLLQSNRLWIN